MLTPSGMQTVTGPRCLHIHTCVCVCVCVCVCITRLQVASRYYGDGAFRHRLASSHGVSRGMGRGGIYEGEVAPTWLQDRGRMLLMGRRMMIDAPNRPSNLFKQATKRQNWFRCRHISDSVYGHE